MMCSIFINLIYLSFPILCYFLYIIYSKSILKEENNIFFDLAIFMSFYLFSKYGVINNLCLFLIFIPYIFSLERKRYVLSFVVLLLMSYELSLILDTNIMIILFGNLIIFILSLFTKLKSKYLYLIVESVFLITSIIINNIYHIEIIISYFLTFFLIVIIDDLYKKVNEMINVYYSLNKVLKEKKLYESLFKITHEIKNPLAVCKGYLDMFDINNKNKANKYIAIINQEINRTLELLKDFSNVSKSININKCNMDVTLLIEDVCDEAKFVFNKDVRFKFEIYKNEIYIDGDYDRLKQVLVNIIKNAKESILKSGTVVLNTKANKKNYEINIIDDGCGMEKAIKAKIGTPFFTTKKNGTGLGVCFSKEIIEKHNGSLKYYSKYGKGTKVKIVLPIKNKA